MATAHLVHGYLCSGKTAFAARLEQDVGGVRFCADEWYLRLFADGTATAHLDRELWDRLDALMDDVWPRVLARGVDVVLDHGFWTRRSRDAARRLARAAGAEVRLHHVTCAADVARARCLRRNRELGLSFHIDTAAFDALRAAFEPLAPDEPHDVVDTTP